MSCCEGGKSCDLTAKINDSKPAEVINNVKEYYGKVLRSSKDLKTNACCSGNSMPKHIRQALGLVHDEVIAKYYGCGLVIPDCLSTCNVLDLGSGSGRDCFVLSKLVGSTGKVTGIDMTDEQLEIARKYIDYHQEKFGYTESNVVFLKGFIEQLGEAGLQDNTFDIIVSNCVVNLSPDKTAVLKESFRVLKAGGELYFSDVYADQNLPKEVRENKILWGECIAGALYWKDLHKIAAEVGFTEPRLVDVSPVTVDNEVLQNIVGEAKFVSATYRLFKIQDQKAEETQVMYNGTIVECNDKFVLDIHNAYKTGEIAQVDADVAAILQNTRFSDYFTFCPPGASKTLPANDFKQDVMVNPFAFMIESTNNTKGIDDTAICCDGSFDKKECNSAAIQ
ncbi:arsenite methyltransferase-like isoform X2 [Ptychodera flava]